MDDWTHGRSRNAGDAAWIELQHAADTFLRDMPSSVQGDELVGDRTFGDGRIQLRLEKQ